MTVARGGFLAAVRLCEGYGVMNALSE